MKKFNLILILVLIIGIQDTYAQEKGTNKVNSARIFKISEPSIIEGYLYQLKDSTISVSSSLLLSSPTVKFHEIDVYDIREIEIRKKGEFGKRILIGALSGFAIGGIIGYASGGTGDDSVGISAGGTALWVGTVFSIGGVLTYGVSGGKVNIKINGNKGTYYRKNRKLKKYLLVK
jgi:hypothetical protein